MKRRRNGVRYVLALQLAPEHPEDGGRHDRPQAELRHRERPGGDAPHLTAAYRRRVEHQQAVDRLVDRFDDEHDEHHGPQQDDADGGRHLQVPRRNQGPSSSRSVPA